MLTTRFLSALICLGLFTQTSIAETGLDLLNGFDSDRIESAFPITDESKAGEVAKILFRLKKTPHEILSEKAKNVPTSNSDYELGDVLRIEGEVNSLRRFLIPKKLVEFLGLKSIWEISLKPDVSDLPLGESILIFAPPLSGNVEPGDRVSADGVILEMNDTSIAAIAAGSFGWFPTKASTEGMRLLTSEGVDASAVSSVSTRNTQPLTSDDRIAFYSMMAAAGKIGSRDDLPKPARLRSIQILKTPEKHAGEWMEMKLNSVRVIRVNVPNAEMRSLLGQDHYFQVDCSAELGDVVIEMARPKGDPGPPIQLDHSYPVSVVTPELPTFLVEQIQKQSDGDALVMMVSHPVKVSGFFFRLWSYESDFMSQQGGGKQVGLLMVASQWEPVEVPDNQSTSIAMIGYAMAGAIAVGILATVVWSRMTSREDRETRHQQQERESAKLEVPNVE